MVWIIAAIIIFIAISFVFVIFYRSISSAGASSHDREDQTVSESKTSQKDPKIPVSKTPIDLSVFDKICEDEKDGKVDYTPISEEAKAIITDLLNQQKPLPPNLLKQYSPIKIVYADHRGEKSVRDIIPNRVIGSVDVNEEGTKEYDFYIEAYCLLRKGERSFHVNGISAAWVQGRENNLGNYLATLYKQSKQQEKEVANV
jgi:hypothetical protein